MATWWGAGECLHYVMSHQPASCIFWCPDQDRAEKCIKYCKVLYGQQDERLKAVYPPEPIYSTEGNMVGGTGY